MRHEDFHLGSVFYCGGSRWRVTDKGQFVVVAIRLGDVEVVQSTLATDGSKSTERTVRLTEAEAEAQGWFNGPIYAIEQVVFDADDFGGCTEEEQTGESL